VSFDLNPKFATEGTYTPDNLIADGCPHADTVTVKSGQNVVRGTVMGKCTKDTVGVATAGANTGNGTASAVTLGAKAQAGTYTLRCVTAASNAGTFAVFAPNGERLADLTVGVAYTGGHINLTISDGATDFVVGDTFTVAVSGSGKWIKSLAAAVDGSQDGTGILAHDCDASAGDKLAPIYTGGPAEINQRALTFGTGHTAGTVKDTLAARGLYLRSSVKA
jgi:hypothetical protein